MVFMPQIVYLQTITSCNGHCQYCPFDDIYAGKEPVEMSEACYEAIIKWLKINNYNGRIGFLLHYEPTMDSRLSVFVDYAREMLPSVSLEAATNGLIEDDVLNKFDIVDCVPAGSRKIATARAGNCRAVTETSYRLRLAQPPCVVPTNTMPIAANGSVLLCCQDWRHETVIGTYKDLTSARRKQLDYAERAKRIEFEICRDCMSGRTAEEVGDRLGSRFI